MPSEGREYRDFEIQVSSDHGARYVLKVIESPAGEAMEIVEIPTERWEILTRPLTRSRHVRIEEAPSAEPPAIRVGDELFRTLFRGEIASRFDQSLVQAKSEGKGLRIRLRMDLRDSGAGAFHRLPWEVLHRPLTPGFLGLRRTTPIVRHLAAPEPGDRPMLGSKLRVLVAAASPRDLEPLDLERELAQIRRAVRGNRRVAVEVLRNASLASLRDTLRALRPQVLHFIGHGDAGPDYPEGVLYFEAPDGNAEAVPASLLVDHLAEASSLRLVVLNACETAQDPGALGMNPFSGTATALMVRGVPTVIAMQWPISDDAALAFSETFYRALAAGDSIEGAVTEGRLAIARGNPSAWEWAIPVLFMRTRDGRMLPRLRRWLAPVAGLAALTLAAGWLSIRGPYKTYHQPYALKIHGDQAEVYNQAGNVLWLHQTSGRIAKGEVADLDGDGNNEVVLGVDAKGADTGKVLTFDAAGKLLWAGDTTAPFNYTGNHSDRLAIRTFEIADLFDSGRKQIVAAAIDAEAWYQARLCVFDWNGSLLGSYWHPGHPQYLAVDAPSPGAPKRIVVAAINNDLSASFPGSGLLYTVFLLDPRNVRGEAPPYLGRSGPGSQLWYAALLPKGREIVRLSFLDVNDDGVKEIRIWRPDNDILTLDLQGRLLRAIRGGAVQLIR